MLSVTLHGNRLCPVESDSTWWQTMPCWVWHYMMTDCHFECDNTCWHTMPCWVWHYMVTDNAMLSLTGRDDMLSVPCWVSTECAMLPKVQVAGYSLISMHLMYTCGFAWSDMVHGCKVYTKCAETAAVSCGTSHASAVSTPLWWILKMLYEKAIHSCRIPCERNESARVQRIALYKSDQQPVTLMTITRR